MVMDVKEIAMFVAAPIVAGTILLPDMVGDDNQDVFNVFMALTLFTGSSLILSDMDWAQNIRAQIGLA